MSETDKAAQDAYAAVSDKDKVICAMRRKIVKEPCAMHHELGAKNSADT